MGARPDRRFGGGERDPIGSAGREDGPRTEGTDSCAATLGWAVGGDPDGSAEVARAGGSGSGRPWARGEQRVQSVAMAVAEAETYSVGNRRRAEGAREGTGNREPRLHGA